MELPSHPGSDNAPHVPGKKNRVGIAVVMVVGAVVVLILVLHLTVSSVRQPGIDQSWWTHPSL